MKNNKKYIPVLLAILVTLVLGGCTKLLDKQPITQVVRKTDSSSITAAQAEDLISGVYAAYKGYANGIEFNVLDRVVNGDVIADNAYAGGDNPDNITLDIFKANALNGNVSRDWADAYAMIANANLAIAQVANCTDPALDPQRKNQILGEGFFMRAFTYFDLVRLWGRIPLVLTPPNQTNSEALIKSVIVPQTSVDSVYNAILNDLWFAKNNVRDAGADPSKFIISKGTAEALLAKVYATMSPANWDSVAYYCDQVIPQYSMLAKYSDLWDNNHKNNSEAIWELPFDGYSAGDQVGNWAPSIWVGGSTDAYEGGGWKKFNTPSNDLVSAFLSENDTIRLNNSITFLDITGQWTDAYWTDYTHYPFLTKYNDPANGMNDMYMIRLPDIMLLRAEAYNNGSDITDAANLVNLVRARVNLPPTTASSQDDMALAIEKERRLELAFEGQRWFDLLRTGRALTVMNAQKDGNGNSLNYNVQPYQLLLPVPQTQLDLNPLLVQNPGY
ncbi:MAG: RagB/SusD family nutrient uptake outer membrane protein [Bacteroidota bacterium]|nr:RagB/SusD family nutrient uptake outer membrane protein [Bacteroidota bacterium]MDP4211370.1 RagB/SusD family nutrient uptake outer membrane protein [Bacteroidota bacterium]MDP4251320.1 RagB/SusD family nutrient uptake outer membrane protein [Bacteroidota bacterium]